MAAIRSMTGFGRSEIITDDYRVLVEIKSVNHRYLDLSIKMPRKFNALEAGLRTLLKKYIERGKTDVFVSFDDFTEKGKRLIYNKEIAAEYVMSVRLLLHDSRMCLCRRTWAMMRINIRIYWRKHLSKAQRTL